MYEHGHLAILKGNLSPEGCVAKITGLKSPVMTRPGAGCSTTSSRRWPRSWPTESCPAT